MIVVIIAQDHSGLDCWPSARIATACLELLEAPRNRWLPATNDGQLRNTNAAKHQMRDRIATAMRTYGAIPHSSTIGARLKTP